MVGMLAMRSDETAGRMGDREIKRLAFDLIPQLPSNPDDARRVVDFMRHLLVTHLGADADDARPNDDDAPVLRVVGGTSTAIRGG